MVLNINNLWKSVENIHVPSKGRSRAGRHPERLTGSHIAHSGYSLRACSACAGDYEDPDRTAWTDDEDLERGDSEAEDDGSQSE